MRPGDETPAAPPLPGGWFEPNLAELLRRSPDLDAGALRRGLFTGGAGEGGREEPQRLQLLPTPAGQPTARLGPVFLHSRYDPAREADRLVRESTPPGVSLGVFYGFGLGYLVESFVRLHPSTPVAVVEPDPGLFAEALAARDLRPLLADPRLHWFLGGSPAQALLGLEELPLGAVQVVRLRSVHDLHAGWYGELDGLLQGALARREVNTNTLRRFGRLWVRNLLANLEPLLEFPGLRVLEAALQGLPAVVLAAGPSLEEFLPLLPQVRERAVLIAVDTSLRPCLSAGVEPDFLLVVDPQYWNSRHLDRAAPRRTVLISETSTWPGVFRSLRLPTFLASSIFPLGRHLEGLVGAKGALGAGGSVATSAWDFARLAGCAPIFMAGMDLGFPGLRTHARGTFFEELRPVLSRRLEPAEELAYRYLREAGLYPCPANGGGSTLSDRRMEVYRGWFETQMRLHPAVETRNLSREGTRIAGMPYQEPAALLALPRRREEIERRLEEVRRLAVAPWTGPWSSADGTPLAPHDGSGSLRDPRSSADGPPPAPGAGNPARGGMRRALQQLQREQAELERLSRDGLDACRRLEAAAAGAETARALRRLEAVDAGIQALASRQVAAFLLHPLIQELTQRAPEGGREAAVQTSRRLYTELLESARYHRTLLQRCLARLAPSAGSGSPR